MRDILRAVLLLGMLIADRESGVAQALNGPNLDAAVTNLIARVENGRELTVDEARTLLQETAQVMERGRTAEAEKLISLIETSAKAWSDSSESLAVRTEIQFRRAQLLARRCQLAEADAALAGIQSSIRLSAPGLIADWEDESGLLVARRGDFMNAAQRHTRAVAVRRSQNDVRGLGRSLNRLAVAQISLSEPTEAQRNLTEALGIFKNLADDRGVAISRMNHALWLRSAGRLREAHGGLQTVLKSVRGIGHQDLELEALANLAAVLQAVGQFREALTNAEVAVQLNDQVKDCRLSARLHNTLGVLCRETGDYQRADVELNRALRLARANGDRVAEFSAQNNIGWLAMALNQTTNALEVFTLLTNERRAAGDQAGEADSLENLAAALSRANQVERGRDVMEQALNLRRVLGNPTATARVLIGLGTFEANRGGVTNALDLFHQAIELAEQSGARALQGSALNNLGVLQKRMGRFDDAHGTFARALAVRAGTGDPVAEAVTLNNVMALSESSRRLEEAVFFGKAAVARFQGVRSNVFWLNTEAQQAFRSFCQPAYRRLAGILVELGRLSEAQQVLTMLKEEEYFDYLRGGEAGFNTTPGWSTQQAEWKNRYEAISGKLVAISHRLAELDVKAETLDDAERREREGLKIDRAVAVDAFRAFLTDIHRQAVNPGDLKERGLYYVAGMQSTLRDLGAGTVLIHYIIGESKLHIILTTPKMQVARFASVSDQELNTMVFNFGRVLRQPGKDPRPLAQELYRLLLAPLADDLRQEKAKTLMVSLDGALRYLPLAALHDGRQYVTENYRVVLFTEMAKDKLKDPPVKDWSVAGMGLTQRVESFDPLPFVREELAGIVRQSGQSTGILPGVVLLDEQFKLSEFTRVLNQKHPVVHIASHFVFRPVAAGDSYLLLGDRQRLTLNDMGREQLNLQDVALLTLSACETAVSAERPGSGGEVEGFAVEAQRLGAKGVLATLWPVADRSTSQFMQFFYQQHQRSRGMNKAEALRQAQLALLRGRLKQIGDPSLLAVRGARLDDDEPFVPDFHPDPAAPFAHPFYWAPFVLMGNWL